uniref:RING-type domain-containing protein n=1 Tax=Branchiostoma floridae TaxID=7739 RepID=C3XSG1_BRAFL|eukprot:XP_002612873.1 hypothetical protein BRAFLDRAFT_102193 [Branchiostoma floridae]
MQFQPASHDPRSLFQPGRTPGYKGWILPRAGNPNLWHVSKLLLLKFASGTTPLWGPAAESLRLSVYGVAAVELFREKKMWPYPETEEADSSYYDNDWICGICRQDLRAPRTLPCRHIFCGACLDDLALRKSPLMCPICESPTVQPAMEYIVPQPGKAVVGPSLVQARLRSITCTVHPQERLTSQCWQCKATVCAKCLDESHKGHETTALASRESLQGKYAKQVDSKQRTEDFLKNLDTVEKSVTENHLQTKQSINDEYELLSQKLLNRRDVLLREVNDNLEHNMADIARERKIAQNQLEELNKVQATNGKKEKLKSKSNVTIPVLLQPSTIRFEVADADPNSFNIGRVVINGRGQGQGSEDDDKETDKSDDDEDVGCLSALTNNIPNFFTSTFSSFLPGM